MEVSKDIDFTMLFVCVCVFVCVSVVLTHATLRLPAREGENKQTKKGLKRR